MQLAKTCRRRPKTYQFRAQSMDEQSYNTTDWLEEGHTDQHPYLTVEFMLIQEENCSQKGNV